MSHEWSLSSICKAPDPPGLLPHPQHPRVVFYPVFSKGFVKAGSPKVGAKTDPSGQAPSPDVGRSPHGSSCRRIHKAMGLRVFPAAAPHLSPTHEVHCRCSVLHEDTREDYTAVPPALPSLVINASLLRGKTRFFLLCIAPSPGASCLAPSSSLFTEHMLPFRDQAASTCPELITLPPHRCPRSRLPPAGAAEDLSSSSRAPRTSLVSVPRFSNKTHVRRPCWPSDDQTPHLRSPRSF